MSQGLNALPNATSIVAQANAIIGSQPGSFLNDQELKQFMKKTYMETQGNNSNIEIVYAADANGGVVIKTQAGCEKVKCELLSPVPRSAVGAHTRICAAGPKGLSVNQVFDMEQRAAMVSRDMPSPGDTAF